MGDDLGSVADIIPTPNLPSASRSAARLQAHLPDTLSVTAYLQVMAHSHGGADWSLALYAGESP